LRPPTVTTPTNNIFRTSLTFPLRNLHQQQRISLDECGRRYMGHTVRIILTQDVSDGKLYTGDIATVKAGYARNYLIPQKKAVYATRQNFIKLNVKDPELETAEERQARLDREAVAGDDKDLKAADILRRYLQNKVVR
jgi:Ribosomal protein L9, N-terminal domain